MHPSANPIPTLHVLVSGAFTSIGNHRELPVKLTIYLQAKVLFFEDERETASHDDAALAEEIIHLLKNLDRISETHRDYNVLADIDLKSLSFLIPSIEGFTPKERRYFLNYFLCGKPFLSKKTALNPNIYLWFVCLKCHWFLCLPSRNWSLLSLQVPFRPKAQQRPRFPARLYWPEKTASSVFFQYIL